MRLIDLLNTPDKDLKESNLMFSALEVKTAILSLLQSVNARIPKNFKRP